MSISSSNSESLGLISPDREFNSCEKFSEKRLNGDEAKLKTMIISDDDPPT